MTAHPEGSVDALGAASLVMLGVLIGMLLMQRIASELRSRRADKELELKYEDE
jgi:hypothetical protein